MQLPVPETSSRCREPRLVSGVPYKPFEPGSDGGNMEGHYANYFKVGFNDQEVVIDFGQHLGGEETLMYVRIVICRAYLSTLITMLEATNVNMGSGAEAPGN